MAPPEPTGTHRPEPPAPAVPPVVAVVVTHDPGPWLDESLRSLADQTYPGLSVLVVDAASGTDPTARIAEVLPRAYVRRLDDNPGYGAATNQLLGAVEGAAFYLLCHDDVALEPGAVRAMVEEAFRSNAGVVGPKLVGWDDPAQLRQVGAMIDKTGVRAPLAEPGELDQQQHDAVRDVFVVPGGCTLVRADLFHAVGGFDEAISFVGEDLDLCWRAHLAGARVIVAPAARVRHLEALGRRRPDDDRRLQDRHRLRTVLTCYGPWHLVRVLPQAVFVTLIEALHAVAAGDGRRAGAAIGAWTWNLRRLGELRARRRDVARVRQVQDAEVRELQVRGSARVTGYVRGRLDKGDERLAAVSRAGLDLAGSFRARSSTVAVAAAAVVGLLVAVGSRNLVLGPIPAIGGFAAFPDDPGALWHSWLSGWRTVGLGSDAPVPTALGALGLAGYGFLGGMGLLRAVLIVGLLPLGALGAWWLARPIGSLRAGVAAFVVYAAIPVPYNALAGGAWGGLALYAAAPWILLALARASGMAPYGRDDLAGDSPEAAATPPSRTLGRQILALGLLLGVVGMLVPFVVVVALLVAVALAAGSLCCGRLGGSHRILATAAGAGLMAAVLHLPWTTDLVRPDGDWSDFVGIGATDGGAMSVGDLLRFQSGPFGAPPLGWAFLVAAALPVIIGRGWRFEWAVRAWFLALTGWGVPWAGEQGWLPFPLPPPEVLLAPAAVGLALAAALGTAAFEVDLPGYRFGWRQAVSSVAAVAVVVGALPLVAGVIDGRWKMPSSDLNPALAAVLASDGPAPSRVLWLGAPEVVPVGGHHLDAGLVYAATDGRPGVEALWAGSADGATGLLADAVDLADARHTNRLGQLLAPMGIRYVVVPERSAPAANETPRRPPPGSLTALLASQLDLEQVDTDDALTVYRNTAWVPLVSSLPADGAPRDDFTDALGDDLAAAELAVGRRRSPTAFDGRVDRAGPVLWSSPSSPRWELEVDGRPVPHRQLYGWANGFTVERAGPAALRYDTPTSRLLLCAAQVVVWLAAIVALRAVTRRHAGGATGRRTRRQGRSHADAVVPPTAVALPAENAVEPPTAAAPTGAGSAAGRPTAGRPTARAGR